MLRPEQGDEEVLLGGRIATVDSLDARKQRRDRIGLETGRELIDDPPECEYTLLRLLTEMVGWQAQFMRNDRGMLRRKVRVGRARHGRGVFSQVAFQPDQVIGEVRGRVIDDPEYGSSYSMDLGGTLTLEPRAPFRYLNHSCSPNCELFMYEPSDDATLVQRMFLQAIAPIGPGDELTIDYGWPAETAIPCDCSSPNCRRWIVDPTELHLLPEPAELVAQA